MARIGDNSVSKDQLCSIIERIERLEEEKAGISNDIKDVYSEAKGNGYDTKTLRKIIQLRKKDAAEIDEEELLLDTYKRALGMIPELDEDDDNSNQTTEKENADR